MAEARRHAFAEVKLKKVNRSFNQPYTSKKWTLPKLPLVRSLSEDTGRKKKTDEDLPREVIEEQRREAIHGMSVELNQRRSNKEYSRKINDDEPVKTNKEKLLDRNNDKSVIASSVDSSQLRSGSRERNNESSYLLKKGEVKNIRKDLSKEIKSKNSKTDKSAGKSKKISMEAKSTKTSKEQSRERKSAPSRELRKDLTKGSSEAKLQTPRDITRKSSAEKIQTDDLNEESRKQGQDQSMKTTKTHAKDMRKKKVSVTKKDTKTVGNCTDMTTNMDKPIKLSQEATKSKESVTRKKPFNERKNISKDRAKEPLRDVTKSKPAELTSDSKKSKIPVNSQSTKPKMHQRKPRNLKLEIPEVRNIGNRTTASSSKTQEKGTDHKRKVKASKSKKQEDPLVDIIVVENLDIVHPKCEFHLSYGESEEHLNMLANRLSDLSCESACFKSTQDYKSEQNKWLKCEVASEPAIAIDCTTWEVSDKAEDATNIVEVGNAVDCQDGESNQVQVDDIDIIAEVKDGENDAVSVVDEFNVKKTVDDKSEFNVKKTVDDKSEFNVKKTVDDKSEFNVKKTVDDKSEFNVKKTVDDKSEFNVKKTVDDKSEFNVRKTVDDKSQCTTQAVELQTVVNHETSDTIKIQLDDKNTGADSDMNDGENKKFTSMDKTDSKKNSDTNDSDQYLGNMEIQQDLGYKSDKTENDASVRKTPFKRGLLKKQQGLCDAGLKIEIEGHEDDVSECSDTERIGTILFIEEDFDTENSSVVTRQDSETVKKPEESHLGADINEAVGKENLKVDKSVKKVTIDDKFNEKAKFLTRKSRSFGDMELGRRSPFLSVCKSFDEQSMLKVPLPSSPKLHVYHRVRRVSSNDNDESDDDDDDDSSLDDVSVSNEADNRSLSVNDFSSCESESLSACNSSSNVAVKIEFEKSSSAEDDEVKNIMESCEELDRGYLRARSVGDLEGQRSQSQGGFQKLKRSASERKYEEIGRKRSQSIDNAALHQFDFARYGISVGQAMPHDLLPGIEEFLCNVLANEKLSTYAEEQRQYYLERLDIIKLPPSVPPRPQSLGVPLFPVSSSPPNSRDSFPSLEQEDFAAYQRELSRALETSPDVTEVKVYDDIDTGDNSLVEISPMCMDVADSLYEIPQLRRTISDSGYERAVESCPLTKSTSSEEQLIVITPASACGPPMPPPLPPRRDRTASDAASRSSVGSMLEDRAPDPPKHRRDLNRKHSMPNAHDRSFDTKSEKLDDLILDDDGCLSCDSMDDISGSFIQPTEQNMIRLPRPTRRKARGQSKLGKSLSSLWEVTQPFSALEDIVLSGELYYKSKLSWTKKLVALTNGRLVCYKIDKPETRPSFVIMLTGYLATVHKREGRRSHELHLDHDNFEPHVFLVDFKEWAETWCEHLNAAAEGKRAPGPVVHLARESLTDKHDPSTYHIEKKTAGQPQRLRSIISSFTSFSVMDLRPDVFPSPGPRTNSNMSLASSDGGDSEKNKKILRDHSGTRSARMGSIAHKASQFFESLGRKTSIKKPSRSSSNERLRTASLTTDKNPLAEEGNTGTKAAEKSHLIGSQSSLPDTMATPVKPDPGLLESPLETSPSEVTKHIKHQGFLDIYSSFNKRKWGKRWCMVHENNFECYRSPTSDVCELEFLLRNCVLRRAMAETKSELGLMLLENNREKITIEPLSWSELGSWLRILMQETSTQETPDGLQGYMDDTHPYHEAAEITRKPIMTSVGMAKVPNRDSGICSSESNDGKSSSFERTPLSPPLHKSFTDSNIPRVNVNDTAIYSQVRKNSAVAKSSPAGKRSSPPPMPKQLTERILEQGDCKQNDANSSVIDSGTFEIDDDRLFSDFEKRISGPDFVKQESLVDEILSQLNSNVNDNAEAEMDETGKEQPFALLSKEEKDISSPGNDQVNTSEKEELSQTFDQIDQVETPTNSNSNINIDVGDSNKEKESNVEIHIPDKPSKVLNKSVSLETGTCDKLKAPHLIKSKSLSRNSSTEYKSDFMRKHAMKRKSSTLVCEENTEERLKELRTRLVQLKQDRITIRDRKDKITSEIDRQFLTEEFERLNRECVKVAEEIKTTTEELEEEQKDRFDDNDDLETEQEPAVRNINEEATKAVKNNLIEVQEPTDVVKIVNTGTSASDKAGNGNRKPSKECGLKENSKTTSSVTSLNENSTVCRPIQSVEKCSHNGTNGETTRIIKGESDKGNEKNSETVELEKDKQTLGGQVKVGIAESSDNTAMVLDNTGEAGIDVESEDEKSGNISELSNNGDDFPTDVDGYTLVKTPNKMKANRKSQTLHSENRVKARKDIGSKLETRNSNRIDVDNSGNQEFNYDDVDKQAESQIGTEIGKNVSAVKGEPYQAGKACEAINTESDGNTTDKLVTEPKIRVPSQDFTFDDSQETRGVNTTSRTNDDVVNVSESVNEHDDSALLLLNSTDEPHARIMCNGRNSLDVEGLLEDFENKLVLDC